MTDCKDCHKLQRRIDELERLIKHGPQLNKYMVQSLAVMARRADWLQARDAIRASEGKPSSFDMGEVKALRWAIMAINAAASWGRVDQSLAPNIQEAYAQSRLGLPVENLPAGA